MEPESPVHYFDTISQVRKSYARVLEPVCRQWGLTRNELDVLLFLHNNPEFDRAADIVRHRGIAKSHVSLSVSALEHRGLLECHAAPGDRRAIHLGLTDSGITIAQEGRSLQEAFFRRLFAGISPKELEKWKELTKIVQNNIQNL